MKRVLFMALAILLAAPVLTSCKKDGGGDNEPGVYLNGRELTVIQKAYAENNSEGTDVTMLAVQFIDGSLVALTVQDNKLGQQLTLSQSSTSFIWTVLYYDAGNDESFIGGHMGEGEVVGDAGGTMTITKNSTGNYTAEFDLEFDTCNIKGNVSGRFKSSGS